MHEMRYWRRLCERRLDELRGIDAIRTPPEPMPVSKKNFTKRKFHKLQTLAGVLRSNGFTELTPGNYSQVFTHPNLAYIVKLYTEDPCYTKFVKTIRAHEDNPHFPRIIGKGILKLPGEKVFGVRIEKLQPTDMSLALIDTTDAYLRARWPGSGTTEFMREQYGALLEREVGASFVAALDILAPIKPRNCFFNVTPENIMKRADGTQVIIDPLGTT